MQADIKNSIMLQYYLRALTLCPAIGRGSDEREWPQDERDDDWSDC